MDRALADLERQLTAITPAWSAPGFAPRVKFSLDTLSQEDLGFGRLDGLSYEGKGTTVLVTTPVLLRHWIGDHNRWWNGSDNIPQPLDAAIRSEPFWTYATFDDARGIPYGEVTITAPKGSIQSAAMLATFAQDLAFDAGPTEILVAVIYPDRAFLARQKLTGSTQPVPVCEAQLRQTRATHLEEKADRDYRACFAAHLREQPHYDAIRKQAQALVDLLH